MARSKALWGAIAALGLAGCGTWQVWAESRPPEASQASSPVSRDLVQAPYEWRNVAIGGMGFVTGIVIHPQDPEVVYARTDVGGLFRWEEGEQRWVALMDGLPRSQRSRYGIESVALDPTDPQTVYVAAGMYLRQDTSDILRSRDGGRTWEAAGLRSPTGKPVRMGGNEEWRWAGERLAVDPQNSQKIYFGSRLDGLYRSTNGGDSWQALTGFPALDEKAQIAFVEVGPEVLYVGVINQGIYASRDDGQTWQRLAGGPPEPQRPQQSAIAPDGTLYVTFFQRKDRGGGVWRYRQDRWQDITPKANKDYGAIALDPTNPQTLLVSQFPLSPKALHRSQDGGDSWQPVALQAERVAWWPDWHLYTLMGGLAIDPQRPQRVWLTNGFGVLRTEDITQPRRAWQPIMQGLEELVTFVIKSPPVPGGADLLSGVADMDGFRHLSRDRQPTHTYDRGTFGDTTGLDFSEADPRIVARVGSFPGPGGREDSQSRGAYSSDNGRTWTPFEQPPPGAVNGKIALSATLQANGKPVMVWAPQDDVYPHRSLDGGRTWQPVKGAPNRTTLQLWFPSQAIASDRVDGQVFYLYHYGQGGTMYRSDDSGATWRPVAKGLPDSHKHHLQARPGQRGDLWLSFEGEALYRSTDAGETFEKVAQIAEADKFAFGGPAPGRTNPTIFVYGIINGQEGLFRSDDATSLPGPATGATWRRISTTEQTLSKVKFLEGDRRVFGRVYVGTGGRGIFYGEPRARQAPRP
ncbi:carbohydrate-binding protein [Geitlerinema sp. PCC 7407]|uniref:carbohydrate-binding protein n=1 Tax=Geitlerinema sp. PCC 7407 TaxID=1173025 RepID=UPI00029FE3D7|nr:carbohydrate-binding protein [Geitlerinema sp. PCC 7407]AFY66524.1 carbohydrate-binding protein [Geitlerinema sp. PCC 7407]